jgi:general stress protein CsbA
MVQGTSPTPPEQHSSPLLVGEIVETHLERLLRKENANFGKIKKIYIVSSAVFIILGLIGFHTIKENSYVPISISTILFLGASVKFYHSTTIHLENIKRINNLFQEGNSPSLPPRRFYSSSPGSGSSPNSSPSKYSPPSSTSSLEEQSKSLSNSPKRSPQSSNVELRIYLEQ